MSPAYDFRTSSSKGDDGTLMDGVATVGKASLLTRDVGSKSGRRDDASATTLSRPRLYFTKTLYSAKKDSHLAIFGKRCGLFTAVRSDAWSVYTMNGLSPMG